MIEIGNSWQPFLDEQYNQPYYQRLRASLAQAYKTKTVYPEAKNIYAAYRATPPEKIKVVILGQDPYHQPGQAHGLSFSVRAGLEPPPSLVNIFKEIKDDCDATFTGSGDLTPWAEHGVFLLNATLTVEQNSPNSHAKWGWETLTDATVRHLRDYDQPMVFLLWGRNARLKRNLIDNPWHKVLEAAHPSPLSAYSGFFGCRHFSAANEYLVKNGCDPIDWSI